MLLYRLDFLHRGSPVLPGAVRWTHHTNYRKASCDWVGRNTWARELWELERSEAAAEGFTRERFLAGLSPAQRRALGAPEGAASTASSGSAAAGASRM